MGKLAEKLKQLGYKDINLNHITFKKCINDNVILIQLKDNKIIDYFIEVGYLIISYKDIINLQNTYFEFHRDLAELKEVEQCEQN